MEEKNVKDAFKENALNLIPLWDDITLVSKLFLKRHLKRYIPLLGISFLFFLITISSLLPIYFYQTRIEVYLISFLFCILLSLILFIPSVLSFIDVIVIDTMNEAAGNPIDNLKTVVKYYFNGFFGWIIKIFRGHVKILSVILKSILIYVTVFILIIFPAHFIKISAEPEYFFIFTNAMNHIKIGNINEKVVEILNLTNAFTYELVTINLLSTTLIIIYMMFHFYFILFRTSSLAFKYNNKDTYKIVKYSMIQNKWSFAAFFVNSFKYLLISFFALLFIFGLLFSFVLDNYLLISLLTIGCSTFGLYITLPFFIKQIEEISLSFTDIYLEGLSTFLNKKKSFKNNEEQEIVNLEVKKIEGVLQLIKQDRKELYLKRKTEKSKIQQEILQNEEPKQNDEALEKYFEELDKEIQKYIDD